jgi:hypothetical protein
MGSQLDLGAASSLVVKGNNHCQNNQISQQKFGHFSGRVSCMRITPDATYFTQTELISHEHDRGVCCYVYVRTQLLKTERFNASRY